MWKILEQDKNFTYRQRENELEISGRDGRNTKSSLKYVVIKLNKNNALLLVC